MGVTSWINVNLTDSQPVVVSAGDETKPYCTPPIFSSYVTSRGFEFLSHQDWKYRNLESCLYTTYQPDYITEQIYP